MSDMPPSPISSGSAPVNASVLTWRVVFAGVLGVIVRRGTVPRLRDGELGVLLPPLGTSSPADGRVGVGVVGWAGVVWV